MNGRNCLTLLYSAHLLKYKINIHKRILALLLSDMDARRGGGGKSGRSHLHEKKSPYVGSYLGVHLPPPPNVIKISVGTHAFRVIYAVRIMNSDPI